MKCGGSAQRLLATSRYVGSRKLSSVLQAVWHLRGSLIWRHIGATFLPHWFYAKHVFSQSRDKPSRHISISVSSAVEPHNIAEKNNVFAFLDSFPPWNLIDSENTKVTTLRKKVVPSSSIHITRYIYGEPVVCPCMSQTFNPINRSNGNILIDVIGISDREFFSSFTNKFLFVHVHGPYKISWLAKFMLFFKNRIVKRLRKI